MEKLLIAKDGSGPDSMVEGDDLSLEPLLDEQLTHVAGQAPAQNGFFKPD